jgi:hypothetical protein
MPNNNELFYADLPVNNLPLIDLFEKTELFYDVPHNWHVVVTDIKNSTLAVKSGKHENVNLIATGSIVSVLNIAFKANITVPFFFGGDGATFIVPPTIIEQVMKALLIYKHNTFDNFELELRTGAVTAADIYEQGYLLKICKFCFSETFPIPVVLGNGLSFAERKIKGAESEQPGSSIDPEEVDLTGMQCRWDKIAPPADTDEVLSLLVVARQEDKQPEVFKKVMHHIDTIYGEPRKRQPISVPKLKFRTTFNRLEKEMQLRFGKLKFFELLRNWLVACYGYIYFSTKKGKTYLNRLVEMSDTLVIDGKINTIISGTAYQREQLQEVLDKMEANGELFYGFHVSNESVMSCYVRDMVDSHIHFVDGAEGGYTKAAGFVKQKLSGFTH